MREEEESWWISWLIRHERMDMKGEYESGRNISWRFLQRKRKKMIKVRQVVHFIREKSRKRKYRKWTCFFSFSLENRRELIRHGKTSMIVILSLLFSKTLSRYLYFLVHLSDNTIRVYQSFSFVLRYIFQLNFLLNFFISYVIEINRAERRML